MDEQVSHSHVFERNLDLNRIYRIKFKILTKKSNEDEVAGVEARGLQ